MNKNSSLLWLVVVFSTFIFLSVVAMLSDVQAQGQRCDSAPVSRLAPGMTAKIVDTTTLALLDSPDINGDVIANLPQDAVIAVVEGFVCYEGQQMWQVEYGGRIGWVTENAQQSYVLEPFDSPPPTDGSGTQLRAPGSIAYNGITFWSPAELGTSITAATVVVPGAPQGRVLTFDALLASPSGEILPRIHVWEVDEYRQYDIYAEQNIALMEGLLRDGRSLPSQQPARSLPFLPQIEGGMTFAVQVKPLSFGSGHGLRYVTHFGTTADLVRPYSYLYTYQGITNDGRYYVSITIPLTSELPEHGLIDFSRPGIYDQYLDQIAGELDAFAAAQFTPSLAVLDGLIESLWVNDLGIDVPLDGEALPTRLTVGESGRVTPGLSNNLRAEPSIRATRVGSLPAGATFSVMDGPVHADGYIWYQVSYRAVTGWTAETDGSTYFVEPAP